MAFRSLILSFLCSLAAVNAITVYSQLPLAAQSTSVASTATDTAAGSTATGNYTGLKAYDPTTWPAPAIPDPAPATSFAFNLMPSAGLVGNISIATPASFFGISIEMSVVTQVCEYSVQVSLSICLLTAALVGINAYATPVFFAAFPSIHLQVVHPSSVLEPHVSPRRACGSSGNPCRR